MGVAEASRRGAARAKRKLSLHSSSIGGSSSDAALSSPSISSTSSKPSVTTTSTTSITTHATGSPPKLIRRDSHLLPASVIAAAEAAYWEDCDEVDDDAPLDGSTDDLRDDGWLSVIVSCVDTFP